MKSVVFIFTLLITFNGMAQNQEIDAQAIQKEAQKLWANEESTPKSTSNSQEAQDIKITDASVDNAKKTLAESEIPVFQNKKEKSQVESSSSLSRIFSGLGILIITLIGLSVFTKRFVSRKSYQKKHNVIRVVNQHSLGPKKSLAIIRVAGESILIGITDHNISLIKSLSFIDEELSEEFPDNFSKSLKTAQKEDEVNEGIADIQGFTIKGLKEVVGQRLRGMKDL